MNTNNFSTVAFHTLGCKVNQHDSETMAALFQEAGWKVVDFNDPNGADAYVINTCTVTHLSDRKSRQMIRRAKSKSPNAIVAVCGCYVEASPDEVDALEEVDILIGTNEKRNIVKAVENFHSHGKRHWLATPEDKSFFEAMPSQHQSRMQRAYVKVQEGCEQFCTYCIIPYARGPLRSRSIEDTLAEIRHLEKNGHKEIILTGIHLGAYGKGKQDEPSSLVALCEAILSQTTIERIRLSSLEPTEVTDALLSLIAHESRMAKHLHLPLQAGSDTVLARMERPYTTSVYEQVIKKVRDAVDGIAITTDFMVGFPGETDNEFEAALAFVKKIAFAGMHLFKYSPRKGTPAADYPHQIDPLVKEARRQRMAQVAKENAEAFHAALVRKTLSVLVEQPTANGFCVGHASNYSKVFIDSNLEPGSLVDVRITHHIGSDLYGEVVGNL